MYATFERMGGDLGRQFSKNRIALSLGFVAAAMGIGGMLVLSQITQVDPSDLTRDVVAVEDTHLYIGALSTTGLMLWAATAGICLLGAAVVYSRGSKTAAHGTPWNLVWFLLYGGLLTVMLCLDDAFLLHERVLPTHLRFPQPAVYLTYIGLVVGFLIGFAPRILRTDYVLLLVSLFFLGMSMSLDEILPYSSLETFVEDSFKFAGIVFWLIYFAWTATETLSSLHHEN
ncbi:hypothetical protein MK489_09820 [Myxococcota bacterium]|nr:hypothetical protein [Myxococcota bacterium]